MNKVLLLSYLLHAIGIVMLAFGDVSSSPHSSNLFMSHSMNHANASLVILSHASIEKTHSMFFTLLRKMHHNLIFKVTDDLPILLKYGVRQYNHLIIFNPNLKLKTSRNLLDYIQDGGNLLLSSSTKLSKSLRNFAEECGIKFHNPKTAVVIDHFNNIRDPNDTLDLFILTDKVIDNSYLLSKDVNKKKIAFKGIAQSLNPDNILTFGILYGSTTAYTGNPLTHKEGSEAFGSDIVLVSGVQARNNARIIFSGSLDLFSDRFLNQKVYSNFIFAESILKWVFGESGVLRVSNIHHSRNSGQSHEKMLHDINRPDQPISLYPDAEVARDSLVYRIKDNLTYAFDVEEFKNGKWIPFRTNDIQLEFVMLDPYVRKTISHNDKGNYSVTFEAPDQYGIFQFRVMYRRRGLSTLYFTTQVSLRPFKHDEYERFIPSAYPYYTSAFSMMLGVFVLTVVFLYSED